MNVTRIIGRWSAILALAGAGPVCVAEPAVPAASADAAAYAQLKSLAGLWAGKVADESGMDVQVRYEVKSGGQAVIEHLFPGTPHEMVTVYFLASGRLQATHYCAIGNQPAYRLGAGSTPTDIRMELAGGTGFDPQADQHAHGVEIQTQDADHIAVEWHFQKGTQPTGSKRMLLARAPAAG
jgi:hypothetical protein